MPETTGVYKFAGIGELAETITQMMSLNMQYGTKLGSRQMHQRSTSLERVEQMILQQARDYLAEVREGFVLSVRTTRLNQYWEARYLLDRVIIDWKQLSQELGFEEKETQVGTLYDNSQDNGGNDSLEIERVRDQLLAFGMAAVALGFLPKLPAERVTFPYSYGNPPTYSDIPSPDTPGAMLVRIEELERMIWEMMAGDLQEIVNSRYGALRRTYGFFESSAHLAKRESERFGIKRSKPPMLFL